jgi:hypothetical protein
MFNEYSQMPERAMGGVDVGLLPTQANMDDVQPSIQGTDRFGLQAQGKGYLLRKYNIAISKKGAPYFEPVQSLLKAFILDAPAVLAEARARVKGDEKLQARIEALIDSCTEYFNAQIEDAGADREWLAKSLVIWPLTDQVGFHMYKAASGEADLVDYATYLFRTDANVKDMNDLEAHDGYQKRQFWTDLAYDELGVVDGLIAAVDPDSTDYNVEAVLRSGYQSAAGMDTRNHLRGVTGHAPVTSDSASADIRSQVLASRRVASQAA